MSISDTLKAQRYASVAEVAAAQAKLYADKLESAPDYAEQAAASALAAAASAQVAVSAESVVNELAISASESATSAAASAAEAGNAAAAAVGQCIRVPTGESVSPLPAAADRINTFLVFTDDGSVSLMPESDVAILDSEGKIPVSMIPAVAISQAFVVSSQAAMLALTAQVGDVAKRTDLGYSFILSTEPASTLSNWVQLTDDVLAQLGLPTGATQVGATDDTGANTTVQGALALKASYAALAANNSGLLLGTCPDIATLRTIEPTADGQRMTLRQHTAGTGLGGGQFRSVVSGGSYTDNNGTVIKTTGGAAWIRINADILNPLMFGAKGDGVATTDVAAVNACIANGTETDLLGLTYTCFNQQILVDNNGRCRVFNGVIQESSLANNNLMYVSGSNKIIENITFSGLNGPTSRGIIIRGGSSDCKINNCIFNDFKNYGIAVAYEPSTSSRCNRITISNCTLSRCGTNSTSWSRSTILVEQAYTCAVLNCHLRQCNWGVSFVQPFTPQAPTEPFGFYNRVEGCVITGSGKTGNPYPESQGISAQSQQHLKIIGNIVEAFNGNGIDNQRCRYSTIQGNSISSCFDGIFVGDMEFNGHNISGNITQNCTRGIRVYGLAGDWTNQIMSSSVIANNAFIDSDIVGIYVYRTEPTDVFVGLNICGNTVDNNNSRTNSSNTCGIQLTGLYGCIVNNNTIRNVRTSAAVIDNCVGTQFNENSVAGYDYANAANPGVNITSTCSGVSVRSLTSFGASTAGPAVLVNGINNTVIGLRWRFSTTGVTDSGTTSKISDNFAF
ncbi:right-handed parallel beta-helix repeat-containing protein [Enterobacter kobei]|uniref:NosD domain-containing protein n=1 Tax=Enterobacter kobei TaxID=208224 RepID=UPI0018C221AF|nr:right-handed parallel beta-helix repeat-containing protein [Enterobacter kobei]MBG0644795.1 right-handed parallel beta-helix repeat-containing protein [Enterobacter kobei]